MSVSTLHLTILSALTLASAATAESPSANQRKPPVRQLRILPIGDSPPFMQEIRDGVSHEVDPPAGELPPRALVARLEPKENRNDEPQSPVTVPLHLNRISPAIHTPDGPGLLQFDRVGEKPAPSPWLGITRPESGDFMILLWRDPKEKNWTRVASMIIADGPAVTPAGAVRIVNVFPQSVTILWGGEKLVLNPASSTVRPIAPGMDVAFEILSAAPGGTPKSYYSNRITQNPGERGFIMIYRADGESPRRPLKVLVFREPVQATPVP
jgi:hypothetical protein